MKRSQDNQSAYSNVDDIDFREIVKTIWVAKWLIGGVTLFSAVFALVIAFLLPDIYRAQALLAPNEDGQIQAPIGQLSSLLSVASMVGMGMGGDAESNTTLALALLTSRKFVSGFVDRHDILVPLMSADGWDSVSGELVIDQDSYDSETETWVRKVRPPRDTVPSMEEAHESFLEILSVDRNDENGYITVAIDFYSPVIAKQWVDWLVEDINSTILTQDVAEAKQAIAYLEKQIVATSIADLQVVFFGLIEEHTKTVMLASISPEYVFRTVDPAIAPEERVKPKRLVIVFIGFLFGLLVSVLFALMRAGSVPQDDP